MLVFVVYTLIDNYVCIDYLLCQSKNLSDISINPKFRDTSFNILLCISIPELLLNIVSCRVFMKKPNSAVILNYQTRLITKYLSKGLSIIEQNTKQLSLLPNSLKLKIDLIDQLDTDYAMVKNKAIYDVANTIKQLHIQKNMHITYKQDFFKNKENLMDDFFLNTLFPTWKILIILHWLKNGTRILMLLLMKKSIKRCKVIIN